MKIIFCDDDHLFRTIGEAILRMGMHDVEIAYDGQDALEKIQANSFDVLVTDYKMPRLTGGELVEKLRELNIPIKVIMITGYPNEIEKAAMDRLRLNGFLKKPFKAAALLECVHNLIHADPESAQAVP